MKSILYNKYFIHGVRFISWSVIFIYPYLSFSNLEFYKGHSYFSLLFLWALFGTRYKENTVDIFSNRIFIVIKRLLLIMLIVFSAYVIAHL